MVDRYTIAQNPYQLTGEKADWAPNYNAHPTQKLPILLAPDRVAHFHWGLMAKWSNNKAMSSKLFNLEVDRALEKTSFRKSLETQRCVALADGYYLWKQIGKKQHTPHYHYLPNQELFGIAGIWESSEDLDGNTLECFMCLMHGPNTSELEEERPVIIPAADLVAWLQKDSALESIHDLIMKSPEIELASHPVSPAIKNTENNKNHLIQPAMPADQHGNYTLF